MAIRGRGFERNQVMESSRFGYRHGHGGSGHRTGDQRHRGFASVAWSYVHGSARGENFVVNSNLLFNHAKRQNDLPVKFIQHLREAGVNRRKAANEPFVTGEMFETRARPGVIAIRQQEK